MRFLPALLFITLAASLARAANPTAPLPLAEAAKKVAGQLEAGGIVTAERTGDKLSYSSAGHVEPAGVPPEKVVFEIGSISKVFTGILLAQAVLEGKLKPDSPLRDLLGKNQIFADPKVAAITPLQLATHTSGLPRIPEGLGSPEDPYASFDRGKLSRYLSKLKLEGSPPFEFAYSNLGFGILGEVLSRLYGKPWAVLVQERITGPLGMHDTTVSLTADQTARFSPPYTEGKPSHRWNFTALAGAGALRSTAADMVRFGDALVAPEKTPIAASLRLMMEPHAPDGSSGFAIAIGKMDGSTVYEHAGGTGGYRSVVQVIPASRQVRVVLINNSSLEAGAVLQATHPAPAPGTFKEGTSPPDDKLAELTGIYTLGESRFTILLQNHHLQARLSHQVFMPLFAGEKPDRFFYKDVAAEIGFKRENGAITALTLFQNGREKLAPKTPDPAPAYHLLPASQLKPYEGVYHVNLTLDMTLKVRGNTLFTQLGPSPAMAVYETAPDVFEMADFKATLHFERNAQGGIIGVTSREKGRELHGVRQK